MRFCTKLPPSLRPSLLGLVACLLAAVSPAVAERPSASRLLPEGTVAMLSIPDVPEMAGRFMHTALGRMSQDPQMRPLVDQLYGSLAEMVAEVQDRIGLTLPELLALPQGEVTVALVAPKEGPLALVVLLEAGSQISNARKLLDQGATLLEQSGARKSEEDMRGTRLTLYDGVGPQQRKIAYFEKDDTIVLGNDAEVIRQLFSAWKGAKTGALADTRQFSAVMDHCRGGGSEQPQALWYVDPVGVLRGMSDTNPSIPMVVAMLPMLGLDGLSAVGGTMVFDAAQFDSLSQIHLLLENPRSGLVKMIALEPGDVVPERWVPSDVATYTTLHWNLETTYKMAATVYDSFRGEGALARDVGQWVGTRTDIDFQQDILPSLEGRVTILGWFEQQVTAGGQAQLLALRLKNTELANKALEKLAAKYPQALARSSYAGQVYFQVQPPPGRERPAGQGPMQVCFGIFDGCLMVANRPSILQKVMLTVGEGSPLLADELEFKLILGKIQRQGGGAKPAMITFNRPEEGIRYWYNLATDDASRERLRSRGENNRLFRALSTALEQNPLPPLETLQRYMAPGGAMLLDDDSGLHYTTFSLRRKTN